MRILITGICGFIGHHFCEHFIKNTDWDIIGLDKLNYSSYGFDRLRDISVFDDKRVKTLTCDLQLPISIGLQQEIGEVDYIINLASESHVDRSLEKPVDFILNNVKLMLFMLEWVKELNGLKKFIQFSTDEVYGMAPEGLNYAEGTRHNPTNPYSASKAAQEDICRAYSNSFGLPIIIANTMNVIGERQHLEKFVPTCIRRILSGEKVIIHADKEKTKAGSRFYIHARNVAKAIHFLLDVEEKLDKLDAQAGQFNIVGEKEIDNLELAQFIAKVIGKPLIYELSDFHSARPGHDLRYALDDNKMKRMGWLLPMNLETSLEKTIKWTLENKKWITEA